MNGIRTSARLAITIGVVGASIVWLSADFGIIPSPTNSALRARVDLAKAIAIQTSMAVEQNRFHSLDQLTHQLIDANPDIVSVGVVRKNGRDAIATTDHRQNWLSNRFPDSCRVRADVYQNGRVWGELQVLFNPENRLIGSWWVYPILPVVFVFGLLTVVTWLVLGQTFRYLDPSRVVPSRVRSALDTLAEGLVLIDPNREIVHTNSAFGLIIGQDPDAMMGKTIDEIQWHSTDKQSTSNPWEECLQAKQTVRGRILELKKDDKTAKYIVNSSPIFAGGEDVKGAIISFDDVTDLERKKNELAEMILSLRNSRDEVARQNKELYFLANCDPLTKCYNRRSFWNQFSEYWIKCEAGKLNVIMVDIDHFKSINDRYGHGVGDEVLKDNGELLRCVTGDRGSVCRFGGEEFVVLVPDKSFDEAIALAQEIHAAYSKVKLGGIAVTASLGVSNTLLGAMDMQHLLDQADSCLYAAKRNGRNQVVRYDQCDHQLSEVDENDSSMLPTTNIKYSNVMGLLSALAFKSPRTAEHCVRVADLCVAIGQKLVPKQHLYRLEVCGLLHDIGKIGVPDQILNKPGPLNESEWELMRKHDEFGESIIRSAFESDEMAEIIRSHKQNHALTSNSDLCGFGFSAFPIESRIITVCDAFDSMIGENVYRRAQPLNDAINEIRRCTPDQFDPTVVEHLIKHVTQPGFLESRKIQVTASSRSAVALARHLEDLHHAVATENLRDLKAVVENLKNEAGERKIDPIADAANRLEAAMQAENAKTSQLMEIAEEVMQLCRSTRNALVTSTNTVSNF